MSTSRNNFQCIENVGQPQDYKEGDMVWAKFKSDPWWPGQIFNKAFARPPVAEIPMRDGCVLVAFFGDNTCEQFNPADLIPFEENFHKMSRKKCSCVMSRKTCSCKFVKAIDEAMVELSWRMGLGFACECRNESKFKPSTLVKDYVMVDVKDNDPWPLSIYQIRKLRDCFQPKDMLSFIQERALAPKNNQRDPIGFAKNKAMVLACRKALYEEYENTYAEANWDGKDGKTKSEACDKAKTSLKPKKDKEKSLGGSRARKSKVNKRPAAEEAVSVKNKRPKKGESREGVEPNAAPKVSKANKRPAAECSHKKAVSVQNKSPKKGESREDVEPNAAPKVSKANKGHATECSHKKAVSVQNKRLKKGESREGVEPNAAPKVSKANKRPAAECSHKKAVSVQNKSPKKGESREDVEPNAAPKVSKANKGHATECSHKKAVSVQNKRLKKGESREGVEPNAAPKVSKANKRPAAECSHKKAVSVQNKRPKKGESREDVEPNAAPKVLNPTMLLIHFPRKGKLPTINELRAKFTRFGPLEHSATKVFSSTFHCRLVYHYAADATKAMVSAVQCGELFGIKNISCSIIVLSSDGSVRASQLRICQPPVPLKSILKKSTTRGNFPNSALVLSSANAQPVQYHRVSCSSLEQQRGASANANIDISQPMINLLVECGHVVNNVMALGYKPYQPLY